MKLHNRFTVRFGIQYPIALGPMAAVADWKLASAVADAGGLGILGAGYAAQPWLDEQLAKGPINRLGVGFITWALTEHPEHLDKVIDHRPAAIVLSFGDTRAFAPAIRAAGIPLICQIQTVKQARQAIDDGAEVIIAQGGEAGGHGMAQRSSFTLIPEVADLLSKRAPDTVLLAAGGIADGRGLAAALALGAEGALVGTRFWAAAESPVPNAAKKHAVTASGDDTIRQHALDIVRGLAWPKEYTIRTLRNSFTEQWHGRESELRADLDAQRTRFQNAVQAEDYTVAAVIVGEVIGQINQVQSAAAIVHEMVTTAERILNPHRTSPATTFDASPMPAEGE